jgi:hypothetical protein
MKEEEEEEEEDRSISGKRREFKSFWDFFKKCFDFFWNISEKTRYFNTGFLFYSVNIQPNIMQN